jgi:hypothetical protein
MSSGEIQAPSEQELLDAIVAEIFDIEISQRTLKRHNPFQDKFKNSYLKENVQKISQNSSFDPTEVIVHPLSLRIRRKMQEGLMLRDFELSQTTIDWFYPFVMIPTLAHSRKLETGLLSSLDPFERNYIRQMNRQVMNELVKSTQTLRSYISGSGAEGGDKHFFSLMNLHFMSSMLHYGIYENEDLESVLIYIYNHCNGMTREQDSFGNRMIIAECVMLIIMQLHDEEFFFQMNARAPRRNPKRKRKLSIWSGSLQFKFMSRFFYGGEQFNPFITSILLSYLTVSRLEQSEVRPNGRRIKRGATMDNILNKKLVQKIVQHILAFFLAKEDIFSNSIRMLDVRSMMYFKKNTSDNNRPVVESSLYGIKVKLTRILHKMLEEKGRQETFERNVSTVCGEIDEALVTEDKNEIFDLQIGLGQVMIPTILFELLKFSRKEPSPDFVDVVVGTVKKITQRNYSAQVQLFEEFIYKHLSDVAKDHPATIAKFFCKTFKKNLRAVLLTQKISKILFKNFKNAVRKSVSAHASSYDFLCAFYYNKIFMRLTKNMISEEEGMRQSALELRGNVQSVLKRVIRKEVLPFLLDKKRQIHDSYTRQIKNKKSFLATKSKVVEDMDWESLKVDLFHAYLRTFNRVMVDIERNWFKGMNKKYFKEKNHEVWLEKPHNYRIYPDLFLFEINYYFRKSNVNSLMVLLAVKKAISKKSLLRNEPLMVSYAIYAMVRLFNSKKKGNINLALEDLSSVTKSLVAFAVKSKEKSVCPELVIGLQVLKLKEGDMAGVLYEVSGYALRESDTQAQKIEKLSRVSQWRLEEALAKLLAVRSNILFRKAFSKNFEYDKIRRHISFKQYDPLLAKFLASDPADFIDPGFCALFSDSNRKKSQVGAPKTGLSWGELENKKKVRMDQVLDRYLESKSVFIENYDDNQITREIKGSKLETPLFIQRLINVILLDVKFAYGFDVKADWQYKARASNSLKMFLQMIEVYPGLRIKIFEKNILNSPIGFISDEGTYGSHSKAAATVTEISSVSRLPSMRNLKVDGPNPSFLDLFAFMLKSFRMFKKNRARELEPNQQIACQTNQLVLETLLKLCTGNYKKLKTLINSHPLVVRPLKHKPSKKTVTLMDHFPKLLLNSMKAKGVFVAYHRLHLDGDHELVYKHHATLLGMATEMCEGPCSQNQRLMRKKYCDAKAKPLFHTFLRTIADDGHPVSAAFWRFKLAICDFFLSLVEGGNKKNSFTLAVALEPYETFLGIVESIEFLDSLYKKRGAQNSISNSEKPVKAIEPTLVSLKRQYSDSDFFSSHICLEIALKTFYLSEAIADQTYSHILAQQQLLRQWKSLKAKNPSHIKDKVMNFYGFLRHIATSIEVVKKSDEGKELVIKKYTFSKLSKCFKLSKETKEEFLLKADRSSHESKISNLMGSIEGFDIEMTNLLISHRKYPRLSAVFSSENSKRAQLGLFVLCLMTNVYVLLTWEWVDDEEWTARQPHKALIMVAAGLIAFLCFCFLSGWLLLNFNAVRLVEAFKYKKHKFFLGKFKILKPTIKFFYVTVYKTFFHSRPTVSFSLWLLTSLLFLFFGAPVFLSLQLLAFINLSESTRYALGSVTKHGISILSSVILVLFIMYDYALLVAQLFPNQLFSVTEVGPDGHRSDNSRQCYVLFQCLLHFITMAGVELGTIAILDLQEWASNKLIYFARFLLDSSSYAILGVLIFNALFFGIILDTFSEMRAAAEERSKSLLLLTVI